MSFLATALLEARAAITDANNKKFELKSNRTNILDGFLKYADQAFPDLANLRSSTTRASKTTYQTAIHYAKGSSKTCAPSGTQGGSAIVPLTWYQDTRIIQLAEKVHFGNEISKQAALQTALYNMEISAFKSSDGIDAALAAFLEAQKSSINAISDGSGQSTWDTVTKTAKISAADKEDFYNYVAAEMELNGYSPIFQEFCNTMWASAQVRKIGAQGAGNDVNTAYQFDGSFETQKSNLLTVDAYFQSKNYIVPTGGVALVTWNDPLNKEKNGTPQDNATGVYGIYESVLYPGIYFDTFAKKSCADTTALGGDKQDQVWDIEFTLNYSPNVMPTSVGKPIFKYAILAS